MMKFKDMCHLVKRITSPQIYNMLKWFNYKKICRSFFSFVILNMN